MVADTNRDSQIEPAEFNQAVIEVGRSAIQAAFNAADTDNNRAVSQTEFDKAIMGPAHVAFGILDANKDNQLSSDELRSGAQILMREVQGLRVPEPANSLSNRIEQGNSASATPTQPATQPVQSVAPAPTQATRPVVPPQR